MRLPTVVALGCLLAMAVGQVEMQFVLQTAKIDHVDSFIIGLPEPGEILQVTYNIEIGDGAPLQVGTAVTVSDGDVETSACERDYLGVQLEYACVGIYTIQQSDLDAGQFLSIPFLVFTDIDADPFAGNGGDPFRFELVAQGIPHLALAARLLEPGVNALGRDALGELPDGGGGADDAFPVARLLLDDGVAGVNEEIIITAILTNEGTATCSLFAITSADPRVTMSSWCENALLGPRTSYACTGVVTIDQDLIDAGTLESRVSASCVFGPTNTVSQVTDLLTYALPRTTSLEATLTALTDLGVTVDVGDTVVLQLEVFNLGSVTANGVRVASEVGVIMETDCNGTVPANTEEGSPQALLCLGNHEITQEDIDEGAISAIVTLTTFFGDAVTFSETVALFSESLTISANDFDFVTTSQVIQVQGDGRVNAGDTVRLSHTVTNNGPRSATWVSVRTTESVDGACTTNGLAPGESFLCRSEYTLLQPDIDNGDFTDTATANVQVSGVAASTDIDEVVLTTIPQEDELLLVQSVAGCTGCEELIAGDILVVTLTLENTGTTTVNSYEVTPDATIAAATSLVCTGGNIAPGESRTCDATITVSQTQLDAGSLSARFQANATAGARVVSADSEEVYPLREEDPGLVISAAATFVDADADGVARPTDSVRVDVAVFNLGREVLGSPAVEIDYEGTVAPCDLGVVQLSPGESANCSAFLNLVQQSIDDGVANVQVEATATAAGTSLVTTTDAEAGLPLLQLLSVTIIQNGKSDNNNNGFDDIGDTVSVEVEVENLGSQTVRLLYLTNEPWSTCDELIDILPLETRNLSCPLDIPFSQAAVNDGVAVIRAQAVAFAGNDLSAQYASATTSVSLDTNDFFTVVAGADRDDEFGTMLVWSLVGNLGTETIDFKEATFTPALSASVSAGPLECEPNTIPYGSSYLCQATFTFVAGDNLNGVITVCGTVSTSSGETTKCYDVVVEPLPEIPPAGTPSLAVGISLPSSPQAGSGATFTFTPAGFASAPTILNSRSAGTAYTLTQADIDRGNLDVAAVAIGVDANSYSLTAGNYAIEDFSSSVTTTISSPSITPTVVDMDGNGDHSAGDIISYDIAFDNNGAATIVSGAALSNDLIANCDFHVSPGSSFTCAGAHTLTQADIDTGSYGVSVNLVTNFGAQGNLGTVVTPLTASSTLTGTTSMKLTLASSVTGLEEVEVVVLLTNDGTTTIPSAEVSDGLARRATCTLFNIFPGATQPCVFLYYPDQDDIDAGNFVVSYTATALDGAAATIATQTSSLSIGLGISGALAAISLEKEGVFVDVG
eukprot:CAMPEP_0119120618 /NCGR_PEP_ID=MMETSP1310-20130426/1579_1 /TAXON_ID=464262 /ORGANISM="Genus nov. species nov., Strain RCC2339" /LENGTH=1306 /DNA_ID=CAMNT_0007110105 /DNA_START=48 /DNA_END=3964 /DNA_ORIENTATION=+